MAVLHQVKDLTLNNEVQAKPGLSGKKPTPIGIGKPLSIEILSFYTGNLNPLWIRHSGGVVPRREGLDQHGAVAEQLLDEKVALDDARDHLEAEPAPLVVA